jgi:tRNA (guanine26-N2/guanine27-N2)-dimethyltransferase
MATDRDLGVAIARARAAPGAPTLEGWDALAATGVRGLRLLHESGAFAGMRLTEAHPDAGTVLRSNATRFAGAEAIVGDARAGIPGPFDWVDLDPYGSPLPFLRIGLSVVRPGGVLAVTATDMMVLAGVQPGASERLYGARPVRGRLGPEGGLRILIAAAVRTAAADGRSVRPLVAYARDHYVRAYLEVTPAAPASSLAHVGLIEPERWAGPALAGAAPFGPMWLGPMFDRSLVRSLAAPAEPAEPDAVRRLLERFREEADVDVPFYYEANVLAGSLGLPSPPSLAQLFEVLRSTGFHVARTHARPEGFRTDAPRPEVEFAAREACAQSQNARVRA